MRFIKGNVERIAATEEQKNKLLANGFKPVPEKKTTKPKKNGGEDNGEGGAGSEA